MFKTFNLLTDTFLYIYYTCNITCTSNTLATSLRPEKKQATCNILFIIHTILVLLYSIQYLFSISNVQRTHKQFFIIIIINLFFLDLVLNNLRKYLNSFRRKEMLE